jgi:hypothetical protein
MQQPLVPRQLVILLLVAALLLPIIICVIVGVAVLLGQMGDNSGSCVLGRIALGSGILWTINLICLLLAIAVGQDTGNRD